MRYTKNCAIFLAHPLEVTSRGVDLSGLTELRS